MAPPRLMSHNSGRIYNLLHPEQEQRDRAYQRTLIPDGMVHWQ